MPTINPINIQVAVFVKKRKGTEVTKEQIETAVREWFDKGGEIIIEDEKISITVNAISWTRGSATGTAPGDDDLDTAREKLSRVFLHAEVFFRKVG